ncbi:MAG: PhnD/SsuA/transferrin family substrate-binding protein [Desulfuromonadales bacterium]|nr:PhnD/SsuA/transferrin family substrate-binding protein [Desulfuromonadales bacterium]
MTGTLETTSDRRQENIPVGGCTPQFPTTLFITCHVIFAMLFCLVSSACAEDLNSLRMGYTGSIYLDVVNTDIRAAVSVLVKKIVLKNFSKGEPRIYDTLGEMATDLKNGKLDAVGMPPDEFMELRKRVPIDPILITTPNNGFDTELLLLVRKDSGIRSVRELRGRSLVMPLRNPRCLNMSVAWLETLLIEEGGRNIASYFSSVKETRTTANAVMPVFFRQADACLMTRQVLDLACELNPQIARELVVIARQEKLSQGIIAVDHRLSEEIREKIRQSFLNLHQTTEGKQLLMLFKVRKLMPYVPGYLKATEALYANHPGSKKTTNIARHSGKHP